MENKGFTYKIQKACYKKESLLSESFAKYAMRSIIAGAFLTMSTAVGIVAADYIGQDIPHFPKFMFAFIFAFGLVYILFLNGELATSNMMYLSAGTFNKSIKIKSAVKILFICTIFNLVGATIFGWLFNQSYAYHHLYENSYLVSSVATKLAKSSWGIFAEAILANIFVNVAILGYLLIKDQFTKLVVVVSAVFMFVFLGNEHVIANFASFMIGAFSNQQIPGFELLNILRQWTFAFAGNLVGGGLCVGVVYAWLNQTKTVYIEE